MLPVRANPKRKRSLEKESNLQNENWKQHQTSLTTQKKHTTTSIQQPRKKQKKKKEFKIDQDYS